MRQESAHGLSTISHHGGAAAVQSPNTAVALRMPLVALIAVPDAQVLTLQEIGKSRISVEIERIIICVSGKSAVNGWVGSV